MLYQDTMTFKQDTSKLALLFSFKITVFVDYDNLLITPYINIYCYFSLCRQIIFVGNNYCILL